MDKAPRRRAREFPWLPFLIFLILTAAIATTANSFYQEKKASALEYRKHQLIRIATQKSDEIRRWIEERIGDISLIAEDPLLVENLTAYIGKRPGRPGREKILAWMDALRRNHQFQSIVLLDSTPNGLLASGTGGLAVGPDARRFIETVRRTKAPQLSDLHANPQWPVPHLDLTTPLMENGAVLGFVLIRISPEKSLYPLIQSWPGSSESAEMLLVRREGNEVLFLNELRHRKGTAMKLRLPLSSPDLVAAAAARRRTGFMIGRDYRGARVWAVTHTVPPMNWWMVVKIDESEVMGPLRRDAQVTFLGALAMISIAGATILFLWQRQIHHYLERQIKTEIRQKALESHLSYLTRHTNDIILLLDDGLRIVETNERAVEAYGYDRGTLLSMTIRDLRAPAERNKVAAQYSESKLAAGTIFETVHARKDGSAFPVESSAHRIQFEGGNYVQDIVRDISERKRAEEEIRSQREFLEKVIDMSPFAMWVADAQGTVQRVNRALCDAIRLAPEQIVGRYNVLQDANLEKQGVMPQVRAVFARLDPARFTIPWQAADAGDVDFQGARDMHIDVSMFPIAAPDGKLAHVVCQWIDITAQKQAAKELELAYGRLRQFIDANIVGVVIAAPDGRIIESNDYYLNLISYSRNEFEGGEVNWRRITPPEWLAADERAVRELRESGRCAPYEKEYLRPDGTRVPVLLADALLPGPEEQIAAFVLDLSEQKRAQAALRESEERYRRTLDNMLEGCQIIDFAWRYLYVNGAVARHGRQAKENLLGRTMMEVYPGIENSAMFRALERCMKERLPLQMENEFAYPDGNKEWFELSMQPVPEGIFVLSIDITERKRAEQEIQHLNEVLEERVRQRTAELSDLYNNAPCGYHSLGPDGVVCMMNDTELRWLGYAREEIVDRRHITELLAPESVAFFHRTFPVLKEREALSNLEITLRRKDGSNLPVLLSASIVHDANGRYLMSRSTLIDYSEQLRARDAVNEYQEKLLAANRELESFSYSVSHDLRAPLRAIDGFSRILREDYEAQLDAEGKRICGVIVDNTRRMTQLIDDLLSFSRLGRAEMHLVEVDMEKMARDVFHELAGDDAGKIQFTLSRLEPAFGDPALLRQVWSNLLGNAVKFTAKKKARRIEAASRAEADETVYFVQDNGAGFDMRYYDKLFGVFQRLHGSSEFPGTGIGLSIVQRVVARHGGRTWAEGEAGKGATFYFALPRKRQKTGGTNE